MRHPIFLVILLLAAADVRAQQDDLRRVLEQGSELRHQQQDQQRLQQAESERPTITIDGQTLRVERTVDDLGQALYLSLQHQQWGAAAFLDEYIELPGHDPLLRHYAQGAWRGWPAITAARQRVRSAAGGAAGFPAGPP
jgi:hypothetical protein